MNWMHTNSQDAHSLCTDASAWPRRGLRARGTQDSGRADADIAQARVPHTPFRNPVRSIGFIRIPQFISCASPASWLNKFDHEGSDLSLLEAL